MESHDPNVNRARRLGQWGLVLIFMLIGTFVKCQQKSFILTDIQTQKQYHRKDSLSAVQFLDSLATDRFYYTEVKEVRKNGENTEILFDKGTDFNRAEVSLPDSIAKKLRLPTRFDTKNLDSLKSAINQAYMAEGYIFNRVKSRFNGFKNGQPQVHLSLESGQMRRISGFVVKGYEKVPRRFLKNLEKEYMGKRYNEAHLSAIHQELQNHPFVQLERPPQTFLGKDSTNIYLFLQKKKASTFDGIIGFGNDRTQKLTFNGSLNLNFRNIFNSFEAISIAWKRSPDKSQNFDMQADVPYLFGSNLGMALRTNIFRQDSAYANLKFIPTAYFHLSGRQKIGIRGYIENSTVSTSQMQSHQGYIKRGGGLWYEWFRPASTPLFLYNTRVRAEADLLSVTYETSEDSKRQTQFQFLAEHNIPIHGSHWLNLKGETAMLKGVNDIFGNELLRFGGWNSMRGFNENSLFADFYYFGNSEYRYLVNEQAFFDVFAQYGGLQNSVANVSVKLYSFGVGFNFFLPVGLMSFQISNGNETGAAIRFGNTKIHWGILARF